MEIHDYKTGITNILLAINTNCVITEKVIDFINELLEDISSDLVNEILDIAKSKLMVTDVRKAVEVLFKGNLKRLALAEGNRVVCLYTNGLIEFAYEPKVRQEKIREAKVRPKKAFQKKEPKAEKSQAEERQTEEIQAEDSQTKVVRRKKKVKEPTPVFEFSSKICDLMFMMYPEASLPDDSLMALCEIIEDIAVGISDIAEENGGNFITQKDVRYATESFLPPRMSKHAIAEGARMVFLYVTGTL